MLFQYLGSMCNSFSNDDDAAGPVDDEDMEKVTIGDSKDLENFDDIDNSKSYMRTTGNIRVLSYLFLVISPLHSFSPSLSTIYLLVTRRGGGHSVRDLLYWRPINSNHTSSNTHCYKNIQENSSEVNASE